MPRHSLALAVLVALFLAAAPGAAAAASPPAKVLDEAQPHETKPLRELAAANASAEPDFAPAPERVNPLEGREARRAARATRASGGDDALAGAAPADGRTPAPSDVFGGIGNPTACGGCLPPDTIGDVGPNHYVQMVNATKFQIFNKAGTPLTAPVDLGTLFSTSPCTGSDGDPVVLYDELANRWFMSQFAAQSDHHLCFAVSQTADPTGAYNVYQFDVGAPFPDYFKVGVWPNGYYVSANENTYKAYWFDRAEMLAGVAASAVEFGGETNFLLPADVDGTAAPGPNEGGIFYTFKDAEFVNHGGGVDRIEVFRLNPNPTTPASSTFGLIESIPIASFKYTVCGFFVFNCVKQAGGAPGLDVVSEWPMHRLVWRKFAGHESLVGNFTVGNQAEFDDGDGEVGAGVRWFELRGSGSDWSLFQEGTHDPPDGLDRFMGSIAMASDGSIALGYSASNSTSFPSIRYAARDVNDPLGTLQAEQVMQPGAGSQTSASGRWGDYSSTNVDPTDGCTFWHTNEFYAATSGSTWSTAIGNFRDPACPDRDGDDVTDASDACPDEAGTGADGCSAPPDGDADGVPDAQDECPTAVGLAPDGCPDNDISFGKAKLNKKKGTAKLKVRVPGDGELTMRGKNLKSVKRAGASARPVAGAGTERLKIKPKGKAKKKLNRKGKAKVKPKVTFTPTGGKPNTETTKVKLKKK